MHDVWRMPFETLNDVVKLTLDAYETILAEVNVAGSGGIDADVKDICGIDRNLTPFEAEPKMDHLHDASLLTDQTS